MLLVIVEQSKGYSFSFVYILIFPNCQINQKNTPGTPQKVFMSLHRSRLMSGVIRHIVPAERSFDFKEANHLEEQVNYSRMPLSEDTACCYM